MLVTRQFVGVACVILIASCSSSSAKSESPSRSQTSVDIARAGRLNKQDYPSSWREQPAPDLSHEKVDAAVGADRICKQYRAYHRDVAAAASAASPSFVDPGGRNDSNIVFVFDNEAEAKAAMDAARSSDFPVCLTHLFTRLLNGKQSSGWTARVSRSRAPNIGDDAITYFKSSWVTLNRAMASSTLLAYIRVGRAVSQFTLVDGPPFDADVHRPAVESSIRRLRGALS